MFSSFKRFSSNTFFHSFQKAVTANELKFFGNPNLAEIHTDNQFQFLSVDDSFTFQLFLFTKTFDKDLYSVWPKLEAFEESYFQESIDLKSKSYHFETICMKLKYKSKNEKYVKKYQAYLQENLESMNFNFMKIALSNYKQMDFKDKAVEKILENVISVKMRSLNNIKTISFFLEAIEKFDLERETIDMFKQRLETNFDLSTYWLKAKDHLASITGWNNDFGFFEDKLRQQLKETGKRIKLEILIELLEKYELKVPDEDIENSFEQIKYYTPQYCFFVPLLTKIKMAKLNKSKMLKLYKNLSGYEDMLHLVKYDLDSFHLLSEYDGITEKEVDVLIENWKGSLILMEFLLRPELASENLVTKEFIEKILRKNKKDAIDGIFLSYNLLKDKLNKDFLKKLAGEYERRSERNGDTEIIERNVRLCLGEKSNGVVNVQNSLMLKHMSIFFNKSEKELEDLLI